MSMMNARRARRHAVGYALLEALLAVIVTAIGFIGAARMQTYGMTLTNSGQSRQKATLLAYQLSDRVRANSLGIANYNNPAVGAKTCLTSASGCTPAELAVADYTEWTEDVAYQLKGGTGVICLDSADVTDGTSQADHGCDGLGTTLVVKLWWEDTVGKSSLKTTIRPS
jgi:type IV pilus assembly protein PilV